MSRPSLPRCLPAPIDEYVAMLRPGQSSLHEAAKVPRRLWWSQTAMWLTYPAIVMLAPAWVAAVVVALAGLVNMLAALVLGNRPLLRTLYLPTQEKRLEILERLWMFWGAVVTAWVAQSTPSDWIGHGTILMCWGILSGVAWATYRQIWRRAEPQVLVLVEHRRLVGVLNQTVGPASVAARPRVRL